VVAYAYAHDTTCCRCGMPGRDVYDSRDAQIAAARAWEEGGKLCDICRSLAGARSTDPGTSGRAAHDVLGREGSQRHKLLLAFATGPAMTADEAMRRAGVSERSCYWKRISELREAGLIEKTGAERPGEQGSSQIVSQITEAGRAALRGTSPT
jgi:hypothetical protein